MPDALGLAVSGGGDSMALLLLGAELLKRRPSLRLVAFTVDHGLRSGSRGEAEAVAQTAAEYCVPHEILSWRHTEGPPGANIQAEARAARYALMAERRRGLGVGPLVTAHTADDAAESFLLRLARGSGVDGLAAMSTRRIEDAGVEPKLELWRPFLDLSGEKLRDYCRSKGVDWIEDPSNADPKYARTQVREALVQLEHLGLTRDRLLRTAEHMSRARAALISATEAVLREAVRLDPIYGALKIDRAVVRAAPREIGLRALATMLRWVGGGAKYPPRFEALEPAFDAVFASDTPGARTLHGCVLVTEAPKLWIGREPQAAPRIALTPGVSVWDERFRVTASEEAVAEGLELGPIGEAERPKGERLPAAPGQIRASAPTVWRDGAAIAVPGLEYGACGVSVAVLQPPFC